MCTLQEDLYVFMIIPCIILLRLRNVSRKNCRENQNTLFIFSTFFENFAAYEVNVGEYGRGLQITDDNIIRCMHLACWLARPRI